MTWENQAMLRQIPRLWLAAAVLAGAALATLPARAADKKSDAKMAARPKVEVVFCLDTTGSMGGLIEGAKQKIWSICNQIASGKPVPALKVGLVAYRDRGDDYVTKVFDLTDDLDAVHGNLKGFTANGGGDTPESVNQGLDDAVNKINWSTDKKTLRLIFLVGDAPPHMDYKDDVKYPDTCKKACAKGIIINSIQCGADAECQKFWKDICAKAEGSYAQIAQAGGVLAVATPYDKELAEINGSLSRTTLAFGAPSLGGLGGGAGGGKVAGEAKARAAVALPVAAAADRAAYSAKMGRLAAYDLVDAVKERRVKLEDLKPADLPEEMKKMSPKEREEYLKKVEKKRDELRRKALELDKKRSEYIEKKLAETKKGKDGFDEQVLDSLRRQAKKAGIDY